MKSLAAAILLLFGAAALGAQAPRRSAPLRLVRCAPHVDVPCLQTMFDLSLRDRLQAATLGAHDEASDWSGMLAGGRLVGPGMVTSGQPMRRVRLLVLIDRTSGMSGEGMAFTRIALKAFLAQLDTAQVRVAVAGFDKQSGLADVGAAPFLPPAQALGRLDAVAAPDAGAQSALAPALIAAATRIGAAKASGTDTIVRLIVVTTGPDVAPAPVKARRKSRTPVAVDAPAPVQEITAALAAVEATGQRAWLLQLGTSAAPLAPPAGSAGELVTVPLALDPNALADALSEVGRELLSRRALTFGLSSNSTAGLARAAWPGAATLSANGAVLVTQPLVWHPPVFALPAYQGVADSAMLTPAIREAMLPGAGAAGNGWLIALLLALSTGVLCGLVPRLAWARPMVPLTAPAAPAMTTTRLAAATREAAPRNPEDITHQTARRTALQR